MAKKFKAQVTCQKCGFQVDRRFTSLCLACNKKHMLCKMCAETFLGCNDACRLKNREVIRSIWKTKIYSEEEKRLMKGGDLSEPRG